MTTRKCGSKVLVPCAATILVSMADKRGGGQGAYHQQYDMIAAALAVYNLRQVPAERRFDVGGALLGPMPTKSNNTCVIHPAIAK